MIRNIRISELLLAGTPRRTPSPVTECRLSGLVIRQTQYTFLINDTANKKQKGTSRWHSSTIFTADAGSAAEATAVPGARRQEP